MSYAIATFLARCPGPARRLAPRSSFALILLIDDVRSSMMARLFPPASGNAARAVSPVRSLIAAVLVCILTAMVAPAGPAVAQTTGADSTVISFDQAVNIALDQNTNLKRASAEARRAETNMWAERLDWMPSADVTSRLSRNFGRSFSQEEGRIVNESTDFFSIDGNASLTFQGLGVQNWSSMRSAEYQSTSADLSLERSRQDVVFRVMNNYISLLEQREILVVQKEELEARRQQLRQIEEFVDAGSRPISALYEQQAAVAEAESAVLTAERDVQLAESRLIQVLRLDPMTAYDFQAPELEEDVEPETPYQLDALMQQAYNQRSDLRANAASVRAAEREVTSARSSYLPTVSLSAGYGSNWSSTATELVGPNGQVIETFSFFDILDRRRGGNVGISFRYNLFDGLRREQQVENAQVQKLNAQYDLEDTRLDIALEVREAYLNYQTAVKQLDVTEKQLRAARQAREAAQERYNLGAADIVELTNANRNFVQAASQRIRARYNYVFQKKLIAYYVGSLNPNESLF